MHSLSWVLIARVNPIQSNRFRSFGRSGVPSRSLSLSLSLSACVRACISLDVSRSLVLAMRKMQSMTWMARNAWARDCAWSWPAPGTFPEEVVTTEETAEVGMTAVEGTGIGTVGMEGEEILLDPEPNIGSLLRIWPPELHGR